MHAVIFRLKRGHLRAVAGTRSFAAKVKDFTAARFDVMRAVQMFGPAGVLTQKALREALGLSRTTVSKMVRRLVELGLLERKKNARDGRTFDLWLSGLGRRRMIKAARLLRARRPFERRFARAYGEATRASYRAVDRFVSRVRAMGEHLGCDAWDLYPIVAPFR